MCTNQQAVYIYPIFISTLINIYKMQQYQYHMLNLWIKPGLNNTWYYLRTLKR
jgi:hypothetical protein